MVCDWRLLMQERETRILQFFSYFMSNVTLKRRPGTWIWITIHFFPVVIVWLLVYVCVYSSQRPSSERLFYEPCTKWVAIDSKHQHFPLESALLIMYTVCVHRDVTEYKQQQQILRVDLTCYAATITTTAENSAIHTKPSSTQKIKIGSKKQGKQSTAVYKQQQEKWKKNRNILLFFLLVSMYI